jgi:hypothetical protein
MLRATFRSALAVVVILLFTLSAGVRAHNRREHLLRHRR